MVAEVDVSTLHRLYQSLFNQQLRYLAHEAHYFPILGDGGLRLINESVEVKVLQRNEWAAPVVGFVNTGGDGNNLPLLYGHLQHRNHLVTVYPGSSFAGFKPNEG